MYIAPDLIVLYICPEIMANNKGRSYTSPNRTNVREMEMVICEFREMAVVRLGGKLVRKIRRG